MQYPRIRSSIGRLPVLLAGFSLTLACGAAAAPSGHHMDMPMDHSMHKSAAAPAATGDEAEYMAQNATAMDKMMADMNVPPTGNIDRDFTLMMIPHHQGAIDMAQSLLRYTRNPELRKLAEGIIKAQTEEIALMRRIGAQSAPAAAPASHDRPMP